MQDCSACNEYQINGVCESCEKHCVECSFARMLGTLCKHHRVEVDINAPFRFKQTSEAFEEMGGEYWQEN